MPLKNYTSQVPATKSVDYIERKLVEHGAREILKSYSGDGRVTAIKFSININGSDVPFMLPGEVKACEKVLYEQLSRRAQAETKRKIPAQAERTAWKILSDWVEAQMAMIELAQVEVLQVFLPYVYMANEEQTFYDSLKSKNYRGLLPSHTGKKS